ncbi:unnamed protein product [Bathycoccus prasinos]|jgi:hypothetical protein
MTRIAFDAWTSAVHLRKTLERTKQKMETRLRRKLIKEWHLTAVKMRNAREDRKRVMKTTFRLWRMSLRVKDDDEGGEDGTLATTASRNGRNKEEEEKKCSLMRKMFHRWHISALTKKRNEREKEFVKVEVRERVLGENAKEMKARWKSEARKKRACEDALEALRSAALKELEGEKENARDHRRDDGEYGNTNINNNNGKEADESTERLNKRRERLREALMKQKVRLLEEIEREENRERIRARFGS